MNRIVSDTNWFPYLFWNDAWSISKLLTLTDIFFCYQGMHSCIVSLASRYTRQSLVLCTKDQLSTLFLINFGSFLWCYLLSSKWKNCRQKKVKLPLCGEVSIFSIAVLVFCFMFAIFWAANRKASYSWIGQDILVSFICTASFSVLD